jgi:hypothetical protein
MIDEPISLKKLNSHRLQLNIKPLKNLSYKEESSLSGISNSIEPEF